jgi:hypothetical protein
VEWVDGIDRVNGRLMPMAIRADGSRLPVEPSQLQLAHVKTVTVRKRLLQSNFKAWGQAGAQEYLSGLGAPLTTSENHLVFSVEHDRMRFLVPAVVLLRALFRPYHLLADFLFAPQGLEQVCVPNADTRGMVHWTLRELRQRQGNLASLHQPLAWMWSFPSAHKLWHSVYDHARGGRLGFCLPEGDVDLIVRGVCSGNTVYATEARVTRIVTGERPYTYAAGHPGIIAFHDGSALTGRSLPRAIAHDSALQAVRGRWSVSDAEWKRIEPILLKQQVKYKRRLHSLRGLLDGVVTKLGTGASWKSISYSVGNWNNVTREYQQWVKDGRWARVRSVLIEMRGSVSGMSEIC